MQRPTLSISVRKILNRIKSNFIRIETNILGNFYTILRKIRQIVFELKLFERFDFWRRTKTLHRETEN